MGYYKITVDEKLICLIWADYYVEKETAIFFYKTEANTDSVVLSFIKDCPENIHVYQCLGGKPITTIF